MKAQLLSLSLSAVLSLAISAVAGPGTSDVFKDLLDAAPNEAVSIEALKTRFSALAVSSKKAGHTDLFLERYPQEAARLQAMRFVHVPVKFGWCSICHASVEDPSVMREEGNKACLACHKPKSEPLQKAHMGVNIFSDKCIVCHDPHASSEAKIMRAGGQHPAFSSCDSCHAGVSASGGPLLKDSIAEACQMCHPQLADAYKDKVVHGALSMGACTSCHNPHFSPRRSFLRAAAQDFCRTCHSGIPDRGHPFGKHLSFKQGPRNPRPLPSSFDCVSCHRPHSGVLPKLLRTPKKELCQHCHKM